MALFRFTFRAMAAENELQIHACDERAARAAASGAIAEVARIEAKYSRYRGDSALSRINAQAGGASVPIDAETQALLAYADACYRQSGGLFDPTSGVLRRAWRFDAARVPDESELAPLLRLVGWEKVELGPGAVRLTLPGMELDFGGFGKEYAVDRAAQVLASEAIASAMVNLAGDVFLDDSRGPAGAVRRASARGQGVACSSFALAFLLALTFLEDLARHEHRYHAADRSDNCDESLGLLVVGQQISTYGKDNQG